MSSKNLAHQGLHTQSLIEEFLSDKNVYFNMSKGYGNKQLMEKFISTTGNSILLDPNKNLQDLNNWYQAEIMGSEVCRPGSPKYQGKETEDILNMFYKEKKSLSPPWKLNAGKKVVNKPAWGEDRFKSASLSDE